MTERHGRRTIEAKRPTLRRVVGVAAILEERVGGDKRDVAKRALRAAEATGADVCGSSCDPRVGRAQ